MTSLSDKAILLGADNRPPILEKDMYDSWKSIMELYMLNRQHGRMILESVENGPLLWPTVEENGVTKPKKYSKLSTTEAIQADYDVKATNIILPRTSTKGLCIVNMKFLNTLPPEWSKFVTDVRLVRDMHTTNVDELHAYLGQHEYHANKYASQAQSSIPLSITYPSNDFQSSVNHNVYNPSSSIPQVEYAPSVHQQSEFSQPDTGIVVLVFQKGDPINAINHMMSFLTTVVTSRYPLTNNQLRTSSNPRQQATINNERRHKAHSMSSPTMLLINLDAYDSDCDEINSAKIALMANLSHYGFDNLVEAHNQDNVTNNVIYQDVQATSTSEQSNILNQSETEIKSDSNIILYSQYMNESQYITDNKHVNEILTAKLERYKNQVRILNEQNNVNKASASCAQSLEIENLKNTLSEHLKEKESLEQKNPGNSKESNLSSSTTIVEVPKELPKVSMGFEHTKACFKDEIFPFVKALKDLFNSFDQFLIDELTEVQNVFNQMERAVEQHCVEKNKFQDKMKDVLKENERLLEQAISTDIVNIVINADVNYDAQSQEKDAVIMKLKERIKSLCGNVKEEKIKRELEEIETINIELDHRVTKFVAENEHLKQTYKKLYNSNKSLLVRSKE
nr:hypothetical protein [Tanacetum cinerariifolium]